MWVPLTRLQQWLTPIGPALQKAHGPEVASRPPGGTLAPVTRTLGRGYTWAKIFGWSGLCFNTGWMPWLISPAIMASVRLSALLRSALSRMESGSPLSVEWLAVFPAPIRSVPSDASNVYDTCFFLFSKRAFFCLPLLYCVQKLSLINVTTFKYFLNYQNKIILNKFISL